MASNREAHHASHAALNAALAENLRKGGHPQTTTPGARVPVVARVIREEPPASRTGAAAEPPPERQVELRGGGSNLASAVATVSVIALALSAEDRRKLADAIDALCEREPDRAWERIADVVEAFGRRELERAERLDAEYERERGHERADDGMHVGGEGDAPPPDAPPPEDEREHEHKHGKGRKSR